MASPLNKPIKDALETYSRAYDIDQIFVGIHATFSGGLWHTIEGNYYFLVSPCIEGIEGQAKGT